VTRTMSSRRGTKSVRYSPKLDNIMGPTTVNGKGTGWLPDHPSITDYTIANKEVESLFSKVGAYTSQPSTKAQKSSRPAKVDEIRKYCSPVEDQGTLGSVLHEQELEW
jgi:hypothetical protein